MIYLNEFGKDSHITEHERKKSKFLQCIRDAERYRAFRDFSNAIAKYEEALNLFPQDVQTLLILSRLYLELGCYNKPIELVSRAAQEEFENPALTIQLVSALTSLGQPTLVRKVLQKKPPNKWDSANSLAIISSLLATLDLNQLAHEYAKEAVRIDPGNPDGQYVLAVCEQFFGNLDKAAEAANLCLKNMPSNPGAHWLLSGLNQPNHKQRIERIRKELSKSNCLSANAYLSYALHNELHNDGNFSESWKALDQACKSMRKTINYSHEKSEQLFNALMKWSSDEVNAQDGYVDPELTPVFIVGLHRSGTTLTERILSGHSLVAAGGENYGITYQIRTAADSNFPGETSIEAVNARSSFDYQNFGKNYIESIRWRANGSPFITDKLPSNFLNIGFIARALPTAKIILVRRNPVEVGLSSLRAIFGNSCLYSYDQVEFAKYYNLFDNLTLHWQKILPDRIQVINYEDLVNEPELHAKAMVNFCGLEFEPPMVNIKERKEFVSTASSVMMRDGIRKDRSSVWKVYEKELAPMISQLK